MKKIFLLLLSLSIVVGCKTIENREDNLPQDNNRQEHEQESPVTQEKEVEFEFISSSFSVNEEEAELDERNFYKPLYELEFRFLSSNTHFKADLEVYDSSNELLYTVSELLPELIDKEESLYAIRASFHDFFLHRELRFKLDVSEKEQLYELAGDLTTDQALPLIEKQIIGPVLTTYINQKLNTRLFLEITMANTDRVEWVRVIPPDQKSYWDLPWKRTNEQVIASGPIGDSKHANYIENGTYLLQISFGKTGLVQEEFSLVDFFNNERGPNYGLPVATQVETDKNEIKLDINLMEKLDYMEIHLYGDVNGTNKKLGIATFYSPLEVIPKKELMKMVNDEFGNRVKLKYNRDYQYELYLYSKRYNDLDYVSISKRYKLTFQGFGFFMF